MSTLKELLSTYASELNADIKLDRVNVSDVQLKLPAIKGKWVARLMNHKADLMELVDNRDTAVRSIAKKIKEDSPVAVHDGFTYKEAEQHELIKKVDKEIHTQRNIIEYLEKVEKVVSSTTYDIKNLCELIKMETM